MGQIVAEIKVRGVFLTELQMSMSCRARVGSVSTSASAWEGPTIGKSSVFSASSALFIRNLLRFKCQILWYIIRAEIMFSSLRRPANIREGNTLFDHLIMHDARTTPRKRDDLQRAATTYAYGHLYERSGVGTKVSM